MQRREQELREKQEQLVQAAKLATLGELTTGVAHELNNPLNNIGLFIGNVIDAVELRLLDVLVELGSELARGREVVPERLLHHDASVLGQARLCQTLYDGAE